MADSAKAMGKAPSITWKGKEYPLSSLTIDDIAEFEVWLESIAWDAPERTRHLVSEEVYQRRLDAVARQIAAKEYAWGGPAAARASQSLAGKKQQLYLQLKHKNPQITAEDVDRMISEELAQVLAKLQESNADPDGTSDPNPQTATAGT